MDQRLFLLPSGQRPTRITRNDTPNLASAILAFLRKQASIETGSRYGVTYTWIHGVGINLTVRGDDWIKVLPFIQDGFFDTTLVPTSTQGTVLDPTVYFDGSVLDRHDLELYSRIKVVLDTLFPTYFPTSY